MNRTFFLLLCTCLLNMGQALANNVLTVNDVNLPQGGQATIEIGCEFETQYTAFELQLALPEGLSLVSDEDGKPVVERAFNGNHVVSGNQLPSNGNYKFTCYSTNENDLLLPTSGALLRLTVQANAALAQGNIMKASVIASEFTRATDSNGENLADVEFNIHITEFRTILDENSTSLPEAEENANVRVRRTIKADEWSTICLPFAMAEEQTKAAFGNDVQLADFKGYATEEDEDGNIVGISVSFTNTNAIEANHPYIIKVTEPITEFTVDGVNIAPEEGPTVAAVKRTKKQWSEMIGTYVSTTIDNQMLFLSGNKFWYSTGKSKIKAFRAYFDFYDVLTEVENAYSSRISFSFDGETTGISLTPSPSPIREGSIYTLDGRQIQRSMFNVQRSMLKKGIYVKDGKKVVVK